MYYLRDGPQDNLSALHAFNVDFTGCTITRWNALTLIKGIYVDNTGVGI